MNTFAIDTCLDNADIAILHMSQRRRNGLVWPIGSNIKTLGRIGRQTTRLNQQHGAKANTSIPPHQDLEEVLGFHEADYSGRSEAAQEINGSTHTCFREGRFGLDRNQVGVGS